jgi:hypothetical protein
VQVGIQAGRVLIEPERANRLHRDHDPHLPGQGAEPGATHPAPRLTGPAGILAEASPGAAVTQATTFPGARLPPGATPAAATEGFPEVVVAATLAVVTAAFPELHAEAVLLEVASRVEADMVVGGIKRLIGWAALVQQKSRNVDPAPLTHDRLRTNSNRIDAIKIPDGLFPACHQLWGHGEAKFKTRQYRLP